MSKIRITAVLTALLLMLLPCLSVSALGEGDISSPSAVLMDASSGKILFEKNAHDKRPCASITKVMTLLLVMDALDSEKIRLDDVVTTSAHAASMGGSDIWLEEGEQMTVDDMIKATAVASANDAAVALAEHICGTEDDFVAAMNARAKELGMKDTTFKNCNGLDEEGHLTSACDVALMSKALIAHPKIFDYTGIWLDSLRGGETQIVNTNKLLRTYDGITGLKTGTTGDAGSCITATAERNGTSLVGVVLGADSGTARFKDAAALLDYGFANFENVSLSLTDELDPINVDGGMEPRVDLTCDAAASLTLPKGEKEKLKRSVTIEESIPAPVIAGDKVGSITFTLNGDELASFDIFAANDVEKKSFSSIFSLLWKALIKP